MKVFVLGVSGAVGSLLVDRLQEKGAQVAGLVRQQSQRDGLRARGVDAHVGDLGTLSPAELAEVIRGSDVVVHTAGSNAADRETTRVIDGQSVETALEATRLAGVDRFVLVSVLPESWRERDLSDDEEYYFAVKKAADVAVTRSNLDWVILRPSLLIDDAGTGRVALGPAQLHGQISREDVASTLAELVHEPRIRRQILELDGGGDVPIVDAVAVNVPRHD